MPPVITALYAALNAILNIFLANRVSSLRTRHKISIGNRDANRELEVAVRAHGNNAEFVPLALVLLLLGELCGGHTTVLHGFGGALLVARAAHAFGLGRPAPNPFRFGGAAVTYLGIIAMAGYVLYLRFAITTA